MKKSRGAPRAIPRGSTPGWWPRPPRKATFWRWKSTRTSARYLGRGLSIVIDLINPEMIVIGSIYARNENLMKPYTEEVIAREALSHARRVCRVVPAALGEAIGDYAALSVAANA